MKSFRKFENLLGNTVVIGTFRFYHLRLRSYLINQSSPPALLITYQMSLNEPKKNSYFQQTATRMLPS